MRIRIILASLALAALVGAGRRAAGADGTDSLAELRKEKLAAAKDWFDGLSVSYSYDLVDLDELHEASIAVKNAAYDIAATKKERLAALVGGRNGDILLI